MSQKVATVYVQYVLQSGVIEGDFVLLSDANESQSPKLFPPDEFALSKLEADSEQLLKGFAAFIISRGKRKGDKMLLDLDVLVFGMSYFRSPW